MRKPVAPRVPRTICGCRRIACVTAASAALLLPVLIGPPAFVGTAADQRLQNAFTAAADEY
ncbi:hypothetical protein, partial [Streptomyces sp. NPDC058272]